MNFSGIRIKLRSMREQQGLTLREVAQRASLSFTYVNQIETGARIPTIDSLDALVRALEGQLVLSIEESPSPPTPTDALDVSMLTEEDRHRVLALVRVLAQPRDPAREMLARVIDTQTHFLLSASLFAEESR